MKILALEFSSEARSVAVVEAGRVRGVAEETGGRHTRTFAMIERALREAGLEREHLECLAVGLGPGSYTGIRVALSVAQGWQLASGIRVLGVNSVEVMAARAHAAGLRGPAQILLDAQRQDFYAASGEWRDEGPRLEPLQLIGLKEARAWRGQQVIAERALEQTFPGALRVAPDAATLGRIADRRDDFVPAYQLEPVYLRATRFVKAPPPRVIPPLSP